MVKTLGFTLTAVLLFFAAAEGLLLVAGVQPGAGHDDPFLGFAGSHPLFVPAADEPGMMTTAPGKLRYFNPQTFSARKADGVMRVFAVGGSTTFGRPYSDGTSFAGWLREMLPAADPSRTWEVINAGGISYASYRVARVVEELARYEPDVFVVYTGHNEFLERRTYGALLDTPVALREAGAWLDHTRIYTALRRALSRGPRTVVAAEVDALLDRSVGPDDYTRDDEDRTRVLNHFRFNLERIVSIGRESGAEVVLVTPGSNLRDCAPFKSEETEGLSDAERRRAREARAAGDAAAEARRWPEAASAYGAAARIDPRHAATHYSYADALVRAGRPDDADDAYRRALVEDVCALRALPEAVDAVREVAAARDVPLVDWEAELKTISRDGIPGRDWFVDHVHPTVDGHGRIAAGVIRALRERGTLPEGPVWDADRQEALGVRIAARIDPQVHAQSLTNLARVVGWSGKIREAYDHALDAVELDPAHGEALVLAATYAYRLGRLEDAHRHAEAALAASPDYSGAHDIFGLILLAEGDVEGALRHHERAAALAPDSAEAQNNLAHVLIQLGRIQEALARTGRALQLQPEFAEALNNRGIAHAKSGATDSAIAEFEEAIRLRPSYVQAHNNLGLAFAARGEMQTAAEHFATAVRLEPNYSEARRNLRAARLALN